MQSGFPRWLWPRTSRCFGTRSRAGVVGLGFLLLIGGCHAQPPIPVESRTLRLGTHNTTEASPFFRDMLSAEPLVVLDWHGRAQPRLADKWAWEDDGRALSVTLRPGVTFHDGSPLTAQAVAAVIRKSIAVNRAEGFRYLTAIDTPTPVTVVFRLSRADSFLVEALAGTPIVDASTPARRTGPFKLVESASGVRAEKNTAYHRGEPGIDRVDITFYETQRAVFAALIGGEVDMAPEVNPESVEFLQGGSNIETFASVRPFYIPLVFNLRHPILKHPDVRRALTQAIDRDEIVRHAMRGHARLADDPIWPSHWAYNAALKRIGYDPAAARARLDAAGFPVRPAPGGRGMASRFQLRCLFFNRDFQFERIAVLLQRQLEEIGVDLVLVGADEDTLTGHAATGDFDTYVFQLTSGKSLDWLYRFWHSQGGLQSTGYTGADADLDRLRSSRLDADVRIGVAALRQRFFDDVPAAFLAWPETTRAVARRFDIGDRSDPDVFANLWRWRAGPQGNVAK